VFVRILRHSFLREKRRKAIVLIAVTLGTAAASSLADIALGVGDKMNRELKAFGANLTVVPRGGGGPVLVAGEDVSALRVPSYLPADEVRRVKDNFWKNNILGFAPQLDVSARAAGRSILLRGTWFERRALEEDEGAAANAADFTGVRPLNPYWSVEGSWPDDRTAAARRDGATDVLVGRTLAADLGVGPGDALQIEVAGAPASLRVAGILTTGGEEDEAIIAPLETVGELAGIPGSVSRVQVSALTTPEDAVYERLGMSPQNLSPEEFEQWTCTPFVTSIAYELERAWPAAEARVIRRVADSEGAILHRTSGLMTLVALLAAFGATLTVTSALTTSVLERRSEIGLLKALGAGNSGVLGLFFAEAAILGLLGGLIGAGLGAVMARWISTSVFGSPISIPPFAVPLAVVAALGITFAGCILPARRMTTFRPFEVLRGL
jgi:putative ABC transport system permease protein